MHHIAPCRPCNFFPFIFGGKVACTRILAASDCGVGHATFPPISRGKRYIMHTQILTDKLSAAMLSASQYVVNSKPSIPPRDLVVSHNLP